MSLASWLRKRRWAGISSPEQSELRIRLAKCPSATQWALVQRLLAVVRPFGGLDPTVIEPERFERLVDTVDAALDGSSAPDIHGIIAEVEALPALQADEEPEDIGFYALGAVVELLYAAKVVVGEPEATCWAFSRASDLLGFADDDLGSSGRDELLEWMDQSIRARRPADHGPLARRSAAMADQLAQLSG